MENMSPEEQKSLSQLYMFLVQNPKHGAILIPRTFWVIAAHRPYLLGNWVQVLMYVHWLMCVLLLSGITVRSWADVQLLWTQYQTLIWRPAELLNGEQETTCPVILPFSGD